MRKGFFLMVALLTGVFAFSSCSENEDGPGTQGGVSEQVKTYFAQQYPGAVDVSWKSVNGYSVVSFKDSLSSTYTAWYDKVCLWNMTEQDLPFSAVPDSVRNSFLNTMYAKSPWRLDDEVKYLKRNGMESLYIITVEGVVDGYEKEMELYFLENGVLVKEVLEDADAVWNAWDKLPSSEWNSSTSSWLRDWMNNNGFIQAQITEVDFEDTGVEVEFVHGGMVYEVVFDKGHNWLYTKKDYPRFDYNEFPADVINALRVQEGFESFNDVDDVEFYQTANAGDFYCFELEGKYGDDIKVYIRENGEVISKPAMGDSETGSVPVDADVAKFIAEKYPNAIITDREYDDGKLEVEFKHENIKKEAVFNGVGNWMYTEWEIPYALLPKNLVQVLMADHPDARIEDDEVTYKESATQSWYEVEIEEYERELKVSISTSGEIIGERYDD